MHIKSSFTRPTVKRRKAKGSRSRKNGTTVRAGPRRRNILRAGKNATRISAGLLRAGENSRRKRTQEGNTKTLRESPAVCKRGRKRSKESARNTDIITNPAPLTTKETDMKTDIGYGDVSKSAEPANSAPRDSSTLRTIPRIRDLP